jgi:uncharacterized protein YdhG (YjbR/CyaY superfamily)
MRDPKSITVDGYIQQFPPEIRQRLQQIRRAILSEVRDPEEKISYRMPTVVWEGKRVHFAAFDHHVGLYPGAAGVEAFEKELGRYVHAKGSIQFPHDSPLPVSLIRRIVRYRVKEPLRSGMR